MYIMSPPYQINTALCSAHLWRTEYTSQYKPEDIYSERIRNENRKIYNKTKKNKTKNNIFYYEQLVNNIVIL